MLYAIHLAYIADNIFHHFFFVQHIVLCYCGFYGAMYIIQDVVDDDVMVFLYHSDNTNIYVIGYHIVWYGKMVFEKCLHCWKISLPF